MELKVELHMLHSATYYTVTCLLCTSALLVSCAHLFVALNEFEIMERSSTPICDNYLIALLLYCPSRQL